MEPDGELGFMTALAQEPDLILLDIMMPGMDGFAVCRALKESGDTEHIPVIMLTARSRMGDIERAFALNADDYVSKPFEWDELFGKIQRALANRNAVGQA